MNLETSHGKTEISSFKMNKIIEGKKKSSFNMVLLRVPLRNEEQFSKPFTEIL